MSSTRRTRTLALPTLVVHAGEPPHDVDSPVATPLHQSVSFVQEIGTAEGLLYPRYGNTPNADVVQKKLAALDRAEAAVVTSSGVGAPPSGSRRPTAPAASASPPTSPSCATAWPCGGRCCRGPATLRFTVRVTDPTGRSDTDEVVVTVRAPK